MAELSAKSFLGLVQKAGIVAPDRLKQALAELSKRAAGQSVHLDELTRFLLAEELITPWHYEKLISGKYKGFFIGQYKLLSLLGSGGMSSVYLAEHTLSGHRRAIKVLPRRNVSDKSYLDRFYREGRAAASLNHPNIVRIYDLTHENDLHFMVMEYVHGVDLFQKVRDSGPVPFDSALDFLHQAAQGLAHAHARQIVHRDIKPANLLLAADNSIKILDLGLALLRDEDQSLTLMHNEKVMGTADYLAPEQAVNSHEVDPRADIYSLGCTFYYLLTGAPPFPEGTIAQRIAMHQSIEPKPLVERRPDCPPLLQSLCTKMMKKKPADRIQNCAQLIQAIEMCRTALSKAAVRPVEQPLAANPSATAPTSTQPLRPPCKQVESSSHSPPQSQTLRPPPPGSNPAPAAKPKPAALPAASALGSSAAPKRAPAKNASSPAAAPLPSSPPGAVPLSQGGSGAAEKATIGKTEAAVVPQSPSSPFDALASARIADAPRGQIRFDDPPRVSGVPNHRLKRRRKNPGTIRNQLIIFGLVVSSFILLIIVVVFLAKLLG